MNLELIIDAIGWIGSVEVVAAYGLVSSQKISSSSMYYQLLNLSGGAFLIINTYYYLAYPSTFINVVWVIIAVVSIAKAFKKQGSQ